MISFACLVGASACSRYHKPDAAFVVIIVAIVLNLTGVGNA